MASECGLMGSRHSKMLLWHARLLPGRIKMLTGQEGPVASLWPVLIHVNTEQCGYRQNEPGLCQGRNEWGSGL